MIQKDLFAKIENLTTSELELLSEHILQKLMSSMETFSFNKNTIESCKRCESQFIIKYGKDRNGNQRYKCKECGCLFTPTSFSVISGTHCSLFVWKKYIKHLLSGHVLSERA